MEEENKPNLFDQVKNFTGTLIDHVSNGMATVSAEKKQERLNVCSLCPHFNPVSVRCGKCGCFLNKKTEWAVSACPIGKWGAE